MPLTDRLAEYVRACFTGLWIESHEHADALIEIAQLCRDENWRLAVWDIDQGLQISGQETLADQSLCAAGFTRTRRSVVDRGSHCSCPTVAE